MVGPVKRAGQVGNGRRQAQAHAFGHLGGAGVQAAALGAGHADVVRLADEVHAVEVQVGGRFRQRPQGRARIGRAAQHARFLASRPQEDLRAARRLFHGHLRHGQQGRRARGVVDGAVVDMVALSCAGVAFVILAQVVPVRRIDHGFVLEFRVRARHDAGHVELLDAADLAIDCHLDRRVQGDGAERACFRLRAQGVQVLPGLLEQGARHVFLQPAFHRIARAGQVEALVAEAVGGHRPRIRGGRRRVDQQDPGGALAQRFLVLVDPAAVIREGLAGKTVCFGNGRLRVVDHQDEQFAFYINTLEIVPVFFRGADAVAGKHDGRVERHFLLAIRRAKDDVLAEGGRQGLAARAEGHCARWQGLAADDGQRLAVRAIF